MFHMPMSSPMMTTMFGFWSAADADAATNAAHNIAARAVLPTSIFTSGSVPRLAELVDHPAEDRHQLRRRCEARATPRAHVLDAPRERPRLCLGFPAELNDERLPDRQRRNARRLR